MLKAFRSAEEVGVYFAASKTLALVGFVSFAVSAAAATRISEFAATVSGVRVADWKLRLAGNVSLSATLGRVVLPVLTTCKLN